jgi:hypothetical protein
VSRWFRHYAGMMRDDKLVRVAIRSKQSIERVAWVWGAILESAAEIDDDGRYDVDAAEVAYFLRSDQADVDAILDSFAAAGRLAKGRVVKWGNRQFQSDRSKERVAAHRERKRQARGKCNGVSETGNADVTLQERPRNAPETELETDTEVSEPKGSSPRPWALPAGVSLQVWTDFLGNRKRKRLGNTPTAWKAFQDDLNRVAAQTGIPPPKLIEHAAAKGWGSINDPQTSLNGQAIGRTEPISKIQATLDILSRGNQRPGDDRRAAGLPHPGRALQS